MGATGTLGYFWNGQALELTAFGIFPETRSRLTFAPGRVDVPFLNPPAGFAGEFVRADSLQTTYRSSLTNVELNYRYSDFAFLDCELILGINYVNLPEELTVSSSNPGFAAAGGLPGTAGQATYQVRTTNNLIAPQIGLEYSEFLPKLGTSIGFTGKAGWGVNFANVNTSLTRGDGLTGFMATRSETSYTGQVYNLSAFVDFHMLERFKVHLAYTGFWLAGMTLAVDQFDPNLANPQGRNNNNGTVFYHGPSATLEFLF
jgi:hypothetical protein